MNFSRHSDLVNLSNLKEAKVAVIGVGTIGSNAVHQLVSLGVSNISVYDFDKVEAGNLSPAFFSKHYNGWPKVEALRTDILERTGVEINAHDERFFDLKDKENIIITGVDSMGARRMIWQRLSEYPFDLYIDGRMGGYGCQFYTLDSECDREVYINSLDYPDSELMCGEKAFPPLAKGLIPFFIGLVMWRYANGLSIPREFSFEADMGIFGMYTEDGYGSGS